MADRIERAFFNAGPATVTRDFKSHVYFQSPNRFANLSPNFPHGPMASGGAYQRKHSPLCCTAALNRIGPWFVSHMWMASHDHGLAETRYGPCKGTALVARPMVEVSNGSSQPSISCTAGAATASSVARSRLAMDASSSQCGGWDMGLLY